MAFKPKEGKWKTILLPMTASTAASLNSLVKFTSGKLVPATATTAAVDIVGILRKAITSADADYAISGRLVSVLVPTDRHALVEGDVTSGLVAADIGTEVDLTDASTVDRSASAVKVAKVLKVISTTKGIFALKINGSY